MLSLSSFAQGVEVPTYQQPKHEVSLWGAYGLSTLNYDLSYGDRTLGLGYLGGIGYNYFFNYHWSVGLGAEFSVLTSTADVTKFSDNYPISAFYGLDRALNLNIQAGTYKEDYTAYYINVPVMLKYQLDALKQHKFYVAGGLKVGIPYKAEYKTAGERTAIAYNRDSNGNNTGDAFTNFHGFGTQSVDVKKTEFDLDLNLALAFETGMKWKLKNKLYLYTGVFVDYGLIGVRKDATNLRVVDFTEDNSGTSYTNAYNPVINSVYNRESVNSELKSFTGKVSTLSAGLKVQLAFGLGSSRDKAKKEALKQGETYKPLTAGEVDEIVARNNQDLINAQKQGFNDVEELLKQLLAKEAKEVKEGVRLTAVRGFDLGAAVILPTMLPVLEENLATLKSDPSIRVNLVGNTDDIGSKTYNYELGTARATNIKNWLVTHGIDATRLSVSSNGLTAPAIPNVDDANRRYNRRVEFIIVK